MSMLFGVECPVCGWDLIFADEEHLPEDCAAQVDQNAREAAAFKARTEAWDEEMARRDAAGIPRPPTIQFPPTRRVVVSMSNTKEDTNAKE